MPRLVAVAASIGVLSGMAFIAPASDASHATSSSQKATVATFAGKWEGHTRYLTISRSGHAKESIGSGCCDPVIDLRLTLSHARGTSGVASIAARVVAVTVHDSSSFSALHPAPRVGESGRLRLRAGVISEPFTHATYCDRAADRKCGA